MLEAADSPATPRPVPERTAAEGRLSAPRCGGRDAQDEAPRKPTTTDSLWTGLGHELRTPLHAILGNVELLVDGSAGPLSADARACLGDVQNAGRQLMRQVDLVLLLVQAEATRGPGAEDTVDFFQRMRVAAHRYVARPVVEPQTSRLVLRGDSFWLDTLVSTLIEALFPEPSGAVAGRMGIEKMADPTAREVGLRIVSAGSKTRQPAPVLLIADRCHCQAARRPGAARNRGRLVLRLAEEPGPGVANGLTAMAKSD